MKEAAEMSRSAVGAAVLSLSVAGAAVGQDDCGWELRAETGPSPRFGHAMSNDPASGLVVLFGGRAASNQFYGDTWGWDGQTWAQLASTGPTPRHGHAMAYDAARGEVVLAGGQDAAGNELGDTWTWDGVEWTQRSDSGYGRTVHAAMCFDGIMGSVLSVGGSRNGTTSRDALIWTGSAWSEIAPFVDRRSGHGLAYFDDGGETVLFGGGGDIAFDEQTWALRNGQWQLRANVGPVWRNDLAMAPYPPSDLVLLFGGRNRAGTYLADTWLWDGAWDELNAPSPPPGRELHEMAYDSGRKEIVLFGGVNANGRLGDTWVFSCPLCEVDLTGDGIVDTLDFLLFLGAWSHGNPLADWDGNGTINTLDFLAFLNDWVAGC